MAHDYDINLTVNERETVRINGTCFSGGLFTMLAELEVGDCVPVTIERNSQGAITFVRI